MSKRCPVCNADDMIISNQRPDRKFCTNQHNISPYVVVVYDDGVSRVYYGHQFIFEVLSYDKLNIEYIEKMLLLL